MKNAPPPPPSLLPAGESPVPTLGGDEPTVSTSLDRSSRGDTKGEELTESEEGPNPLGHQKPRPIPHTGGPGPFPPHSPVMQGVSLPGGRPHGKVGVPILELFRGRKKLDQNINSRRASPTSSYKTVPHPPPSLALSASYQCQFTKQPAAAVNIKQRYI